MKSRVSLLLLILVMLDLGLATIALFFPQQYILELHGTAFADPMGLVRRLGAGWASFMILQLVALIRYKREPGWLALVAGVRLTEMFCDWVYLDFAAQVTSLGRVGLLLSPPVNILAAAYLWANYKKSRASFLASDLRS